MHLARLADAHFEARPPFLPVLRPLVSANTNWRSAMGMKMKTMIKRFLTDESGLELFEHAVVASLIG